MKRIVHKTGLHIIAWVCLVLGILGLVLPLIPGIPLLIIGAYFLSLASLWFALKVDALKVRYPTFGYYFDIFDKKASKIFKKSY